MGLEEKKRIASEFLRFIGDGARRDEALAMLSDDATWRSPGGAMRNKEQVAANFVRNEKLFKGPIKVVITGITAEGDRVAVESEGSADVINGKHYKNTYHCVIQFRGDKICTVREYCDSNYAADTFADLL